MVEEVMGGLIVAGVLAMLAVPVLACALVRASARARELADRNAAQAVSLAQLQRVREAGPLHEPRDAMRRAAVEAGYASLPAYVRDAVRAPR